MNCKVKTQRNRRKRILPGSRNDQVSRRWVKRTLAPLPPQERPQNKSSLRSTPCSVSILDTQNAKQGNRLRHGGKWHQYQLKKQFLPAISWGKSLYHTPWSNGSSSFMSDLVPNWAETTLLAQGPGDTHLVGLLDFFKNMHGTTTTAAPLRTTPLAVTPLLPPLLHPYSVPPSKHAHLYPEAPNCQITFFNSSFVTANWQKTQQTSHRIQARAGNNLPCLQPTC